MRDFFSKGLCLGFFTLLSFQSLSADKLHYPELEVTPRASERLKMMVIKEKKANLFSELPMQISAMTTLTAGLLQFGNVNENDDPDKKSAWTGVVVGGAWMGINYYLSNQHGLYENSYREMIQAKGQTDRDQLIRERLAEEGLKKAARLSKRLKWMSALTNAGAGAYMMTNVEKDNISELVNALSIVAAFGPLFFESERERVWRDQKSYKKKVYGPILTSSVFNLGNNQWAPGFLFSARF